MAEEGRVVRVEERLKIKIGELCILLCICLKELHFPVILNVIF